MKRLNNLWEHITSFDNLLLAYRKARKGKRSREEVAGFGLELEKELIRIQAGLRHQTWLPGTYRIFTIYERKPRQISAAPFRDRVVHHALMNVVEPLLDRRFIFDTYACRQGHGVHLAVKRYQQWSMTHAYKVLTCWAIKFSPIIAGCVVIMAGAFPAVCVVLPMLGVKG